MPLTVAAGDAGWTDIASTVTGNPLEGTQVMYYHRQNVAHTPCVNLLYTITRSAFVDMTIIYCVADWSVKSVNDLTLLRVYPVFKEQLHRGSELGGTKSLCTPH